MAHDATNNDEGDGDGGRAAFAPVVAALTVTYNPNLIVLKRQIDALPDDWVVLLVDNGSTNPSASEISELASRCSRVFTLFQGQNTGLAAGLNAGLRHLRTHWSTVTHVLLLDQDSEPTPGACRQLLEAHARLEREGMPVGAVGPALEDPETGVKHGFHVFRGWQWQRVHGQGQLPIRCDCINGSGTLMRLTLALDLGGMDERLFIDHVDTEWSFRMTSKGYQLFGVPSARFLHRMGEATTRIWLGRWLVWPRRTPTRHRYLFRNAVILLRLPHVPLRWKGWAFVKLILTACVHGVTDRQRTQQIRAMMFGVADALHGRSGAI